MGLLGIDMNSYSLQASSQAQGLFFFWGGMGERVGEGKERELPAMFHKFEH